MSALGLGCVKTQRRASRGEKHSFTKRSPGERSDTRGLGTRVIPGVAEFIGRALARPIGSSACELRVILRRIGRLPELQSVGWAKAHLRRATIF
jgi:hypothetical protein